jgi:hypothetical protein
MAAARCDLSDLPAESCGHCTGAEARARQAEATATHEESAGLGPWFQAQYRDECVACGAGIVPGDTIRANGRYGYLCVECGGLA